MLYRANLSCRDTSVSINDVELKLEPPRRSRTDRDGELKHRDAMTERCGSVRDEGRRDLAPCIDDIPPYVPVSSLPSINNRSYAPVWHIKRLRKNMKAVIYALELRAT